MKIKRDLTLEESTVDFVTQYKIEHCLRSFSAALDEIISKYKDHQNGFVEEVGKSTLIEIKGEYDEIIKKTKFSARSADINSQVIIEILNTILLSMEMEHYYPSSEVTSTVLSSAQKTVTDRIAYYKQYKENNKYRRGGHLK